MARDDKELKKCALEWATARAHYDTATLAIGAARAQQNDAQAQAAAIAAKMLECAGGAEVFVKTSKTTGVLVKDGIVTEVKDAIE